MYDLSWIAKVHCFLHTRYSNKYEVNFQRMGFNVVIHFFFALLKGVTVFFICKTTGCGKSRSFYCINYRCKESELLGLPLCVLCFSIFSVVLSIEHFQFALIHFLRLDSSHVILNVFNSHVRAPAPHSPH